MEILNTDPQKQAEPESKGIAFVFSHWVEKDNPQELNKESKERLEKAIELYNEGKVFYILVCGGEFVKGLSKPVAKMMTDYLVAREIPENCIIEERRSEDTISNIRFGTFLLGLKELDDLPIYYVSSGYHLKRIKTIIAGQKKAKSSDVYVSSGRERVSGSARVIEMLLQWINKYDPEGRSWIATYMRRHRRHPIKTSGTET